jgi:outer membrane receptor for ferrienterochelin and colicins
MNRGRKMVRRVLTGSAAAWSMTSGGALAQTPAPPTPPPPPAAAAETGDQPAPEGNRTYTPEDFARFAPRTASDMLRQVPGFVIREAVEERGLGQATGNVLLNGRRISGKSDDILSQLGRIPAGNVVRIEILDGAALGIPGLSGQVANIVSRAGGISGQFSYSPEFRANFTDPLLTRFNVSVSGTEGPVEYTLAVENQASRSGAGGPTLIFNRDGSLRETYDDVWTGNFDQPRASARFVIDGPGSSVGNLNLLYREFWYDYVEDGVRTRVGELPRERDVLQQEDGHNYEIGGDFEFPLLGGRLKLIGLQRFDSALFSQAVTTRFADDRADVGDLFVRDSSELERIARAEYRWTMGGADFQISGEAAFNSLDTESELFVLDAGGAYDPVPFPGSVARVEEARYEGILSYGRRLSPALTIQIAAGAEYSQLSQVGADGLTREFIRPKGQVTAAWTPNADTTVNLRLQRRVGQISFFDFVDSVNLQDDTENEGNANLVPPQSWEAEVEAVRRFGPWGQATLRVYYHLVEDIIDVIPIGATGQGIGNIDSATRYGADLRGTINFDPAGWRGARLDLRLLLQETEVEDPLTGELRPISNATQTFAEAIFRYDIPGSDWAVGSAASYQHGAFNYRLTEISRAIEGPVFANVYVENKDVFGLTVRATIGNILDARSPRDRTVYVGRRTGEIDFIEQRDRLIGPIFSLQIRGRF